MTPGSDAPNPAGSSTSTSASADPETREFVVPEMDCPSCAGKVTKSVEKLDGVDGLDANVTTGVLTVTFDSVLVGEGDVEDRIESAGYEVQAPTEADSVSLSVPEMDCASCASKVESALEKTAGVTSMTLQPTTGTARVEYDPTETDAAAVGAAIERAGYSVAETSVETEGDGASVAVAEPSAVWTSSRAVKTWIGAGFLVVGLLVEFLLTGLDVGIATLLGVEFTVADALLLAAVASSGVPVVRSGYYSARNLSLDIDLLMGAAIIAATSIGYYTEAATLAVLFSVAELLEEYAMDRARDSLRELMELSPDEATVKRDGETVTLPVEDVHVGDVVVTRPGEKVPMDGVVVDGRSAVDESPITGESVPVDKAVGDEVYAGSINEEGYLEIEVTSEAGENTLSQIIEMVQGAQQQQTEKEQFVDRFAGYYTPTVVVLAALTAVVPPVALGAPWETWFVRGLTLLVIACPCAFVISTPVSVVSGITSAAKNGVLIKGGNHLEAMGEVDAIAFDKTGTLTKGELTVTDVVPLNGTSERELLRLARGIESRSEHPLADAIVEYATDAGIDAPDVTRFESITGKGVTATIDGETYYAGKPALFDADLDLDLSHAHLAPDGGTLAGVTEACEHDREAVDLRTQTIPQLQDAGKTVVLVGTESEVLGVLGVADVVRPEASLAVERLHELGVEHTVMLTGDNEGTARAIAKEVGIGEHRAELLPAEKVDAVEDLQREYGSVAMIGDGINDAPAIATADVGVAMGAAGTDTALETADVALMADDLSKLPYLYALSHTANGVIRQNIWTSLGAKALLAVGVPLGYVSVALAVVVGDMGMSLGVTGNAMRLSRIEPERFFDPDEP